MFMIGFLRVGVVGSPVQPNGSPMCLFQPLLHAASWKA